MKSDKFCEVLKEVCWKTGLLPEQMPLPREVESWNEKINIDCKGRRQLAFFRVVDEQGKPLIARIHLSYQDNPAKTMWFRTNDMGYAAVFLEEGIWDSEVSKGPGYSVVNKKCEIKGDQTIWEYCLTSVLPSWMEGWIAGDLHHHSVYSGRLYGGTDPVTESPQEVCNSMMASGLKFGALSDHHNTLNHKEWASVQREEFLPLISKEISTSRGHVLALMAPEDVIFRIPEDDERTDTYMRNEFQRIVQQIKDLGGMPQLNHPTDRQKAISWNPDYMDIITIFETMEIWNGSKPMIQGTSSADAVKLWIELLEKGIYLPATTGSDTHNTRCDDYEIFAAGMMKWVNEQPEELRKQWDGLLDLFIKWKNRCLGSGCVCTMVHPEDAHDQQSVVEELRHGRSVLTNGPLLYPVLGEAGPGETGQKNEDLKIQLRSNRRLSFVKILVKGNQEFTYDLTEYEKEEEGCRDYSHVLTAEKREKMGMKLQSGDYLVVMAGKDGLHLAISNPIFVQ